MGVILNAVLGVFGVVLIGFVLRRLRLLTEEADRSLLKVTVNLLMPCLILSITVGNPALLHASNVIAPPIVGIGTTVLGFVVGYIVGKTFAGAIGLTSPAHIRTFAFCVGMYNYGYVPLPLAQMLYNKGVVGVLFVHNMGVDWTFWTIGVMLIAGASGKGWWKGLFTAPALAIVVGLLINFLGVSEYVPSFLGHAVEMLGQCAVPIGLLLIGATISDAIRLMHLHKGLKVVAAACGLRLFVLPLMFLALARFLPVSDELKKVIILQAAMPSAIMPIVVTRHYGGDSDTAVRVVLGTSVVALATIPLWLKIGPWIAGMH